MITAELRPTDQTAATITMMNHISSSSFDNSADPQNEGCLGRSIGGWLNGGGQQRGAASASANDDDPTLLVAEELNKLSLKEREIVYEDLHGVSMVEDESDQELVNQRLNDMKVELETKIPRSKKVAYLIAMEEFGETGKEYCQDRSLHLMFLRADCWNVSKAATRFVGWMDWKLKLFGRDVLCHRYITLDKLNKEGRTMVNSGCTQILPQRDTSGRTVIFDNLGQQSGSSVISILQLLWYMMMSTVEDDVPTQRRGIVYILYAVDGATSFSANDLQFLYDASRLAHLLPVRVCSVHYCFNDPTLRPIFSFIQKSLVSHLRVRFRSHEGKHTEVQYTMMPYGIPADVLPVTTDGNIQKSHHMKWCKRRKVRDSTLTNLIGGSSNRRHDDDDDNCYGIDLPGRFDILLGKGKPIQRHMGNRRLQELASIYYPEYNAAIHGDKKRIAQQILTILCPDQYPSSEEVVVRLPIRGQSYWGGAGADVDDDHRVHRTGSPRFLKQRDDGWWESITKEEAVEKVCHSFRSFRASRFANHTKKMNTTNKKSSSSTSGGSSSCSSSSTAIRTTTAKRVKVETQGVLEPDAEDGDEEDEHQQHDSSTLFVNGSTNDTTTANEDESLLDLDTFDW